MPAPAAARGLCRSLYTPGQGCALGTTNAASLMRCACALRGRQGAAAPPATPGGDFALRSLSPAHLAYHGDYGGDSFRRDSGYHQGPVWSWLIGGYVEAYA